MEWRCTCWNPLMCLCYPVGNQDRTPEPTEPETKEESLYKEDSLINVGEVS